MKEHPCVPTWSSQPLCGGHPCAERSPGLALGCQRHPAKSNTRLEHPPLKSSKDSAAQVRSQGWVSFTPARRSCVPALGHHGEEPALQTTAASSRNSSQGRGPAPTLPRCSIPANPCPLRTARHDVLEVMGPRAVLHVPLPAEHRGPSKPGSACSELRSVLSLSRPR